MELSHISTLTEKDVKVFQYPDLSIELDQFNKCVYFYMHATPVPCFTPTLLESIKTCLSDMSSLINDHNGPEIKFLILASKNPTVFNLGGDLSLFKNAIMNRDRESLYNYAVACIDVLHANTQGHNLGLTTVSLVQGSALGGGLEAALSADFVIAERGIKFGLPEVLFNLFPGMGAFHLLCRRVNIKTVKELILKGHVYTAEEFFDLGIVDYLADPGGGKNVLNKFIADYEKKSNGYEMILKMQNKYQPIDYNDLLEVVDLWVESALSINKRALRTMSAFVARQLKDYSK